MSRRPAALRDFTVDGRVWLLMVMAVFIGTGAAALARLLLDAIRLATNLFFYHRLSMAAVTPAGSPEPRWVMALAPVLGGFIVGAMAYYGSEKIRGHGIPEAIEAILLRGARIEARVALLKPLSAAIAIGSGGPFGAEGPIIMTGGAFGSLLAQWLRLSDAERTTLLVAGAAAGMSAVFAAPLAAILLAVELLLFEWRPRSLVPVAVASTIAGALRIWWIGPGPVFPAGLPAGTSLVPALAAAAPLGVLAGLASCLLSRLMYTLEDGFEQLQARCGIHWAWWPAIGGAGIGIGGVLFPRGLGVGYDNIAELLRGNAPLGLVIGILAVKSLMWAFSLSSGTSGGVLAPLLMIGAAIGEAAAQCAGMPGPMQALWALAGMGAMLAGAFGVPITAIVFSLEVTHDLPALLPLAVSCFASYLVSALVMPRSILTERLSRRGYHLSREYAVDPLETITAAEAMTPLTAGEGVPLDRLPEIFAYSDDPCRVVAEDMAASGLGAIPILDRRTGRLVGTIGATELLAGRRRLALRERERRTFLRLALRRGSPPLDAEAGN